MSDLNRNMIMPVDDIPTIVEAEKEAAEAAMAWFRKRRNCPYNNAEMNRLWKACQKLDAIRTFYGSR